MTPHPRKLLPDRPNGEIFDQTGGVMRLAVRSTVVAVCLAIVALAPMAASARPALDIPRGVAFYPTPTGEVAPMSQRPEVHSNPDQQVVVVHHRTVVPPIL